MAHQRIRHAFPFYSELCRFSPLVGVFGHRQVGKTTFVSSTVEKYVTFDDEETLAHAQRSAKDFLTKNASGRTAIDECQYSPKLFPALKEWVRTRKRPGQFILTGSVRFSSRKAIRESLTGRLVSLELYPLVLSELLQTELPEALPKLIDFRIFDDNIAGHLNKPTSVQSKAFAQYLDQGGMPGLCFMRKQNTQHDALLDLFNLILDRDLRLVTQSSLPLETLNRFLRYLARNTWQPYRYAEAKRQLGLSEPTQKKLLYGLEAIYLIRRIPFLGSKGETYLLEDQLEEKYLSGDALSPDAALIGALYRNLRAQIGYRSGEDFRARSFRTRSGARVPLVFESRSKMLGIIALAEDKPDLSQRRSVDSFLRHHPEAKVIYVSPDSIEPRIMEPRVIVVSAASLVL